MKRIVAAAVLAIATASPVFAGDVAGIPLTLQLGNMARAAAVEKTTKQVSGYASGFFQSAGGAIQSAGTDGAQNGKPAVHR